MRDDDTVSVNDPLYPSVISVPAHLAAHVRPLVDRFTRQPVMSARLLDRDSPAAVEALDWMEDAGLLIRTHHGTLDMAYAASVAGAPDSSCAASMPRRTSSGSLERERGHRHAEQGR